MLVKRIRVEGSQMTNSWLAGDIKINLFDIWS